MDNPVAHLNAYELRHLVAHLEALGRSADIHALLRLEWEQAEEVPFLQQGSKVRLRNAWYAAKERSGDTNGYLADLNIARKLAESAAARRSIRRLEAVALECRYALIATAIRSLAQNHLPYLAARYVQAGIWTRDQALTWAQLNPNPERGLQIVLDALRQDKGEKRDELGRLALTTASGIIADDSRAIAIADFSGNLPPYMLRQALEDVARAPNEGSRLGGLKQLVQKLPRDLRLEALEMAKRFEQPELKAEAIAVVAATLDEPERTEAFHASLAVTREAIAQGEDNEAISFSSKGLARTLPLEWLGELLTLLDKEVPSSVQQSVFAIYLERWADRYPDWVWKQLAALPSELRDEVLSRVALAFVAKGLSKKAMEAAAEISVDFLDGNTEVIKAILKLAPESEWNQCIELFGELSTEQRITVLRELAASPTVSASLLRGLANTLMEEQDRLEARAAIARVLTAAELDEVFSTCCARADDSVRSRIMADLAPYLSVAQTQCALDMLGKADWFDPYQFDLDSLKALVVRLADLGEPDEALRRVSQLHDGISESPRAEVLASLAAHLPDQYLPVVLAATRPDSIAIARVHTRATLIPWLPPETVDDIVSEACGLTDPLARIRVLSEIIPALTVEHLCDVGKVLVASVQHVFPSSSLDQDSLDLEHVLRQGFRILSQLLDRCPSAEVAEQALALAQGEDVSSAGQVALLVDLASVGGTANHVQTALAIAVHIAEEDLELTSILTEGLSADHSLVLADLLSEQDEPWRLVAFLHAVAYLLDDAARHEAYQRVSVIDDVQMRLTGLGALLPHLEQRRRREAVLTELARKSEWSQEPEVFARAIAVLAPNAPDVVRPHLKDLAAAFDRLRPEMKVVFAGLLADGTDFAHELIEKALTAVDELPERERLDAIARLALWLDPLQITHVMSWLSVHQDLDIAPALAWLIRRAAALGNATLVLELLDVPEDEFTRSELIEETAPKLPLETLSSAAALANGVLGALAIRATELGDKDLAFLFLDRKEEEAWYGEDRTLEHVYQLAPSSWADVLIARAEKLNSRDRAIALVQLIDRIPRNQRRPFVESIVESAASLWDEERLRVIHVLEPELRRLPTSTVVSMWTHAMRRSSEGRREEVLVAVRAFARTLVSHFGPEIALKLDVAIRLVGGEFWP